MSIAEKPANPGPFDAQYGYGSLKVETHKYSDKPTPILAEQSKAQKFINSHTDKEHQKKYGKKLFDVLFRAVCQ